jgi:cytoskeletal protein CcmA (bactofilin family)
MGRSDEADSAASAGPNKKGTEKSSQAEPNKLHIGEGVIVQGEVTVPDTIIVDGVLEGEIKTHRLVVGVSGVVRGKVMVSGNADIYGRAIDHLEVKNLLVVRSSGGIEGSVSYGELLIERGGAIAGGISSADYKPAGEAKPNGGDKKKAPRAPTPRPSPKVALDMRSRLFPPVQYGNAAQPKPQQPQQPQPHKSSRKAAPPAAEE